MKHTILHLDIDAFLAAIEQVQNPGLKGRPVVVGTGVVCSASYEARRYGIQAGTALSKARKLCPRLVILRGHYPTYKRFADRIFDICRDFTPRVEQISIDEAFLDLSGFHLLYGHPLSTAERLKRTIKKETNLNVTIGIGANRLIARMASHFAKPNGVAFISAGQEALFIRDMPLEELQGIGFKRAEFFGRLNLQTIGELRNIPLEEMQEAFGSDGILLYERCRGVDSFLVKERLIPKSISRETAFEENTMDLGYIEGMLYYLTERAARKMRSLNLAAKTVSVKIQYSDYELAAMSRSLNFPSSLDIEFYELALNLLYKLYTRRVSLRLVGVALSNFSSDTDGQNDLFPLAPVRALYGAGEAQNGQVGNRLRLSNLYRAIDKVRDRFGYSAITVGKSLSLLNRLKQDEYGFLLRTPSLTQ